MNQLGNSLTSIALAIVGVAILAVIVSKQAQTGAVIQNAAVGFSQALSAAEGPLNQGGVPTTFNYAQG